MTESLNKIAGKFLFYVQFIAEVTSNLLNHLSTQHSEEHNRLASGKSQAMRQISIGKAFTGKTKFEQTIFEKKLALFFAKNDLSFLLVESQDFWDVILYLNHEAHPFKRKKMRKLIIDQYEVYKKLAVNEISSIKSKISFSTDLWTSDSGMPFMTVIAHYINDSWELKTLTLDFILVKGSHTGQRITDAFDEVRAAYKIGMDRHGWITLDNASNNDKFIEVYKQKHGLTSDIQVRCFCHCENLSAQASIGVFYDQIDVLRNAVKFIRCSNNAMERLEAHFASNNEEGSNFVKPILDVRTRWGSTHDMLKTALQLKNPISVRIFWRNFTHMCTVALCVHLSVCLSVRPSEQSFLSPYYVKFGLGFYELSVGF